MRLTFRLIFVIIAIIFYSCGNKKIEGDFRVTGIKNPEILLNGSWKFSINPPGNFWENSVDFAGWNDIQVPGECQMQGFAIKHDQPYVYKRKIEIPPDFKDKEIRIDFYSVYSSARVWVNGNFVREHSGGFTKWSCNITNFVEAGKDAVVTVEITDRTDDISFASGYAKHQIGGILRDVKLVALPMQNFRQLYFETNLDENYSDAELKVFYELAQNSPATVKLEIFSPADKKIASVEHTNDPLKSSFSVIVKNPLKWDAEHPNLYTVVTTLEENGKDILKTTKKIGFREVVVEGNQLLVNGSPVKLRGACRHDIHPLLGRMTTPEYDLKDVLLAKEANMNFIRTSHYPPSEKFLEYCDKYGIYVEDETAVCFVGSHRTEAYRETGATQNDPAFTEKYLLQLEELVQNHRNHPSVIIWSIGNENVFGENFVKSYQWVKQNDATRPVIYSYPGQVPDSLRIYDIISMHYPDWKGNLTQYGISTTSFASSSAPMLFDEWAHVACYNNFELKEDPNVRNFWGQSLDKMWTNIFEADGGLGGAIWCMLDETFMLPENLEGFNQWWGILDPNIIPATYMGPCVGYGEWGILDIWRRKKPEFWETKKAYSPVKIYSKNIKNFRIGQKLKIRVHNRFDHTNLGELKIIWKYINETGVFRNVNIKPHESGNIWIPDNDWNPGEIVNLRFFMNDTFLVDEYNLVIGEKNIELPVSKQGNLIVSENQNEISIAGKHSNLKVNKKTGLLEDVTVNNRILIKSGPYLNLKIPGKRIQYSTIEMEDIAKNWTCSGFRYEIKNGIAEIYTSGKYENIPVEFNIKIDEDGLIDINYQVNNVPVGQNIQEAGLKFQVSDAFDKLKWNREAYFSAYPENHIGKPTGEVDLSYKPEMKYREKPDHDWAFDTQDFYYFGLDTILPNTNFVRSLKENIYSYSLISNKAELKVFSDGNQACRFDKIDGVNTLIINDKWDYNSLLWGNYAKSIKTSKKIRGSIILGLSEME